jgi:hypothetical protein
MVFHGENAWDAFRAKLSCVFIRLRIDHAFQRNVAILHDDVDGRD